MMHHDVETFPRCEYCADQYKKLKQLQTRIVHERPHLKKLRPAALFEKLYETLIEKEKK